MLFGRDAERALIGALLDDARDSRGGAILLRGEAGVGKSALLADARERAPDMRVLTARGVEAESELPFAGLDQLLRPALGQLDRLPAPQVSALRSALGLQTAEAQERFLVYAACLSLLCELAEPRPLLCLVDDAHWLDGPSAEALQFVARRVHAEPIGLLLAARDDDVRRFEVPDMASVQVTGIAGEAAARLLERSASDAAPAVREELIARAHGNPLALIELPNALNAGQLAGREPLPHALPMTRQLEAVFHERASRLPPDTGLLLLLAAADDSESAALVARAGAELGVDADALQAAERAGLVGIHGDRLAFRHPLVRSAVYGAATSTERRAAHRALAAALESDREQTDRRAWHLASSALEHDDAVVLALDKAAERASERGGQIAAARALERAAQLSADPLERGRRLTQAATLAGLAAHDDRALGLADRAAALVADPLLLAELAAVRGFAAVRRGRPLDSVPLLNDAAQQVASRDPAKALDLLLNAMGAAWQAGDRPLQLHVATLARSIVPGEGDDASLFRKQVILGFAHMFRRETGDGIRMLQQAIDWARAADDPRQALWGSLSAMWIGDDQRSAELIARAISLSRRRGEIGALADALGARAAQLLLSQDYDEAAGMADEAIRYASDLRAENLALVPLGVRAMVAALQGRDDDAQRDGTDLIARAGANGLPTRVAVGVYALALVEIGRGHWERTLQRLGSLGEPGSGEVDPLMASLMLPEQVEAAARAGRPADARRALELFEVWVGHSGAPVAQRRLAACRALVADGAEASEHYEAALQLGGDDRPFDLARIELLYGEHLRRERRRKDARLHLRRALEAFERYRAEPWIERAAAELRASGETARRRDRAGAEELTAQERQIARYVAEGLSNKEVAAQLFLSPRTIDAHLRSVFAKLGITSRTQLARISLDGDGGAPASEPAAATV